MDSTALSNNLAAAGQAENYALPHDRRLSLRINLHALGHFDASNKSDGIPIRAAFPEQSRSYIAPSYHSTSLPSLTTSSPPLVPVFRAPEDLRGGQLSPSRPFQDRRKRSYACVHCRGRQLRCSIVYGDPQSRCQNCVRFDQECVRSLGALENAQDYRERQIPTEPIRRLREATPRRTNPWKLHLEEERKRVLKDPYRDQGRGRFKESGYFGDDQSLYSSSDSYEVTQKGRRAGADYASPSHPIIQHGRSPTAAS